MKHELKYDVCVDVLLMASTYVIKCSVKEKSGNPENACLHIYIYIYIYIYITYMFFL